MIEQKNQTYILSTDHTTYGFHVTESGHLEHLYYGRKIHLNEEGTLKQKRVFIPANAIAYSEEKKNVCLEDFRVEASFLGKGDIWEPFAVLTHADGAQTSDFLFLESVIDEKGPEMKSLPGSYSDSGKVEHLCVTLQDSSYGVKLELHYYVYPECDVITRRARIVNEGTEDITLNRIMSTQLDLDHTGYRVTTFHGSWAREMKRTDTVVSAGRLVNSTYAGVSSSRANPFIMVSHPRTDEDNGECYGINLIYSGNHYESVEATVYGKTRVVAGINPQNFSFLVSPGDDFETPEAVMAYSCHGFNGLSKAMHHFVREHIVRGLWKHKDRPILLNSWEAAYFNINESKLLNLAKAGKDVGIELFVVDDGWFKDRVDDTRALGDWIPDQKKLPNGLAGLCNKVKALGMDFGIWVEPEMVNVNSDLYRAHPDWTMDIPNHAHSEGRNQRILDLTRLEVQDYLIEAMTKVFSSAEISYVKWDMNRIFSDYYSKALPKNRMQEVGHRYVCGLYRVMKTLTETFPKILFEGCSSGGNRFDLGILCFFPQIWASDNTDAICRTEIQNGYSYGYPQSCVSAHVSSCPNHQTLRNTPLETRFHVAAMGVLGYECNLADMKKEELERIRVEIQLYQHWRKVLQWGDFYRGRSFDTANVTEWTCVAPDQNGAVGMLVQKLMQPNMPDEIFFAKGLNEDSCYHFSNIPMKHNIKEFGDLVNSVAPIHVKQNSFLHNAIAKFVKLDGETEDYHVYGDSLMYGGIHLKQAFCSTGYNEETRHFPDFASRMYFMERDED